MMPHEGTPIADQVPVDWHNKILHATLKVGDEVLTGADVPPSHYRKPEGFSVMLGIKDYTEAKRIFNALAENGSVHSAPGYILGDGIWYARRSVQDSVDY
jgi:PhnB protein